MRETVSKYARDLVVVALFVAIMFRSESVLDAVVNQAALAHADRGDVIVVFRHPVTGAEIHHRIVRRQQDDTPEKWAEYVVHETIQFELGLGGK